MLSETVPPVSLYNHIVAVGIEKLSLDSILSRLASIDDILDIGSKVNTSKFNAIEILHQI